MTGHEVLDTAQLAVWMIFKLAGPFLLIALVLGVVISLLQAVTQIQEMTLAFAPKIAGVLVALLILMPWMGGMLRGFMYELLIKIETVEKPD